MSVYELTPDQKSRLRAWLRGRGWSENGIDSAVTAPTWRTMKLWQQMCDEEGARDG